MESIFQVSGTYRTSTRDRTLEEEGFIHCSYAHQVAHVLKTYFRDMDRLLVLVIDPRRVTPRSASSAQAAGAAKDAPLSR